eukprot:15348170-Heterocapsa_arctica.AAC.1
MEAARRQCRDGGRSGAAGQRLEEGGEETGSIFLGSDRAATCQSCVCSSRVHPLGLRKAVRGQAAIKLR